MKKILLLILLTLNSYVIADITGSWEGKYIMNGSGWPMRLHIKQKQDETKAKLDIPNLVYANVDTNVYIETKSIKVDLPFGLEQLEFEINGDRLISRNYQNSTDFQPSPPHPYDVEEIIWNSNGEKLFGSLYLPKSNKPKPLLIRLHGSATGSRESWEYASWGDYFARKGVATLVFDRRGEGKSSSKTKHANFNDLANDVFELINYLSNRKDLDFNKVILNGGSQAAYIAFMVTALADEVDYLLLSGASSVQIIEQERQSLLFRMRTNNESISDINKALGYQNLYFHYVRTGQSWDALKKHSKRINQESWAKYVDQPRSESDLKWWRDNFDSYQPEKIIPEINIPVLIFYGENDDITPPSIMIPNIEYLLKDRKKDYIQMKVLPDVGHSLEEPFRKDQWGNIIFPQRSSQMFDEIDDWLTNNKIINNDQ